MEGIPESDWKTFKRLRKAALQRFSQRILDECRKICSSEQATPHERYLQLTEGLDRRREEMSRMFDDLRRSTAVPCLTAMDAAELLEESELAELSDETRRRIKLARGLGH